MIEEHHHNQQQVIDAPQEETEVEAEVFYPTLVSIYPSHYCLKVRWLLDLLKIQYSEDPHPPLFHIPATRSYKAKTVPLFIDYEGVFKDSTDILKFLDKKYGNNAFYSTNQKETEEIEKLEEYFDTKLGPHTRRVAYFYLLQYKDLVLNSFMLNIHPTEEKLFKFLFSPITFLMKKSMNISPTNAWRSKNRIDKIFSEYEKILSDGREFLVGGKFTVADITLASLSAPVLFPDEYEVKGFDNFPEDFKNTITEYRNTLLGKYVLNIFKKYRVLNTDQPQS